MRQKSQTAGARQPEKGVDKQIATTDHHPSAQASNARNDASLAIVFLTAQYLGCGLEHSKLVHGFLRVSLRLLGHRP